MFAMRRRGGDDVEPVLICAICRRPLPLRDSWLGFRTVTSDRPSSDVECPRIMSTDLDGLWLLAEWH
jgi:hypothetical protein